MANLIVDTSALLAYFDASEPDHDDVERVIDAASDLLVVSPYVIAELDYLVATRHGVKAELAVLDELTGGAWELACLDRAQLEQTRAIVDRYADHRIGVADASNVVLAERYRTKVVVTLDRRHFDVLRATSGEWLEVLP